MRPILVLLLLPLVVHGSILSSSTAVPKELLNLLRDSTKYNKHALPTQDSNEPTVVTISMYIEGISSFQATSMDFALDIYFQQNWLDTRLTHNNSRRILVKDKNVFKLMWHPDIYFANARVSTFHEVTEPNFLVWIYQNGTVYYDCRISLTVMCMQNFAKYPLDSQECKLRILSYAYDKEQLELRWKDDLPIERNAEITMPDMEIESVYPLLANVSYATGFWAMALTVVKVRRLIMHHILQNYVPTAIIVIISWFSFWLDIDSVPGRVSLSITTLLTLATQASAARLSLPQVSYIKAIDVWMGTCMGFVFGAMIEFTIVNYWSRRKILFQPWRNITNSLHSRFVFRCEHRRRGGRSTKGSREMRPFMEVAPNEVGGRRSVLHACDDEQPFDSLPKYYTAYEIEPGRGCNGDSVPINRSVGSRIRFNAQPTIINAAGDLSPQQFLTHKPMEGVGDICSRRARRQGRGASPDMARAHNRKVAQLIDQRSRWAFPGAFIMFNLFYWIFYTYWTPPPLGQ